MVFLKIMYPSTNPVIRATAAIIYSSIIVSVGVYNIKKRPVAIPLFSKNPDLQGLGALVFVANFPRPVNGIPRRVTKGPVFNSRILLKV